LTWNPEDSSYPAVAIGSSGNIHIVWQDASPGNFEIYYRKSTDGGTSWSKSKRLTSNVENSHRPKIAVDSGSNVYVIWNNVYPMSTQIYWKKSTDSGSSWLATKKFTWRFEYARRPEIAIDSSNSIYVVWDGNTGDSNQIYFKKSTNSGTTWTSRQLTWNWYDSGSPDLTVDSNGHIHVGWHQYAPIENEIYYKKSIYGGTSWSVSKRLTWVDPPSFIPKIASDKNGRIHVVWTLGSSEDREIFYKRSTDSGVTWTTKRITWILGESKMPAIAVAPNNNIYVVWQDEKPGNFDIYFKKGTQ
jgi:hypothetical protein